MKKNGIKKSIIALSCLVSISAANNIENQKIINIVDNIGKYADEHNWIELKNLFASKVLLDYSSFTNEKPTIVTPDEIITSWSGFLPGFEITQHKNKNHIIKKNGNSYNVHTDDIMYYESPKKKIEDINSTADFLITLKNVKKDGIGVFGICAGAGYSLDSATQNPNIKAVVTAASWLHDAEAVKLFYGGEEGVETKVKQAKEAKEIFNKKGFMQYIPTISNHDETAAMYGNFDYYLNPNRGAIKQWSSDKFAVASWEDWLRYDPTKNASKLDKPTLMIHSDGAVLPQYTKKYFETLNVKDKKLIWLDTKMQTPMHQFNFYDNEKEMNIVILNASKWFEKYL